MRRNNSAAMCTVTGKTLVGGPYSWTVQLEEMEWAGAAWEGTSREQDRQQDRSQQAWEEGSIC